MFIHYSTAKNIQSGRQVAVKQITRVFEGTLLAKRVLREIKLLKHFSGHENITDILDVYVSDTRDIFLVQDLMESDLHQIIRSGQPLTDSHFQYLMYQICRGLKYIHSANVLHRDLKPGNLLVNANCDLRIADFGLARGFISAEDSSMTAYVATRWYRAPEISLNFTRYTKAMDIWSVGCIFAEFLMGAPIFQGRDFVDQLTQILRILGTPSEETLANIGGERTQMYIRSFGKIPKIPWVQLMPAASSNGLDLLEKFLKLDPAERYTVEQALEHAYFEAYHDETDEPNHREVFEVEFENLNSLEALGEPGAHVEFTEAIIREIDDFGASRK
ncbi:Mitogen-activated protein kinase [Entophlyctis sp. JEL0112]|nr:Mitogen-activated protein kinase [Entophlyctis sp. JEL0112]